MFANIAQPKPCSKLGRIYAQARKIASTPQTMTLKAVCVASDFPAFRAKCDFPFLPIVKALADICLLNGLACALQVILRGESEILPQEFV